MNIPRISTSALKMLIDKKEKYVLIDVRQLEECASHGMIPTAHNIPLQDFPTAFSLDHEEFASKFGFSKPTKEDRIITYCRTGRRSDMAALFLHSHGFHVENYGDSIWGWHVIDPKVKRYGLSPH